MEDRTLCTWEIVEEIEALNKASEDISSIVVTMNSIAEETNLLSLNASIEAARAGEAGKGFVVVSEEIRNETEAASSELGDGSSQLFDTVNQLNEAVQMLRENAVDLNSSVKIFKI